jgi:hypothetical protein
MAELKGIRKELLKFLMENYTIKFFLHKTNSMELGIFSVAHIHSDGKGMRRILWHMNIYDRTLKKPLLVSMARHVTCYILIF